LAAFPGIGVITRAGSRWRSSSASITTTHFSSGADGTGRTGSTVPRSAVVVLANKYQGRLGSASNSASEIARDDIIGDRLAAPSEEDSIGTQLLRGE
jgi:hypothetical protein